jgi:hypothetical protein
MTLAFDALQNVFDVVQAADQARSEIEASRAMRFARHRPLVNARQSGAKRVIDYGPEWPSLPLDGRPQPSRDIVIQCERRAHDALMLSQ